VITDRQLQEAIQHQVLYGGRLGTSLYELGFITEERLTDALARAHGVPAIDLKTLGPEAVSTVPKKLAQRYKVFPCKLRGQTLFLGMVDPGDHAAVAQIGYTLGFIVRPVVVPEFRPLRRRRALAPHRHARRRGGGPADPRPRRGGCAYRRRHEP
jgi:Type II secretion system (T2SS), protein E, N-terminal domain